MNDRVTQNRSSLECGQFYGIYSRGNNRESIFVEERNYRYFLKLCTRYPDPVANVYAYCLLPNHFHFLVSIREPTDAMAPSQHLSNLLNEYAKAFNKAYSRTGALFQRPFGRVLASSQVHLVQSGLCA